MKKTLLIISDDFWLEGGGMENTSFLFAQYFSDNYNVITFSPSSSHIPNIKGVISYQSRYNQNSIFFPFDSVFQINTIYKKHHIDYILTVHYAFAPCCVVLKKRYGVPFGVLSHGEEVIKKQRGGFKSTIKHAFYYPIRSWVFNNATQIFSNTHFTKHLVEQITKNKNITVINPPIGLMPEITYGSSSPKSKVLLSIGRLAERKGFQNVIKALPEVLKQVGGVKYILAGDGEYRDDIYKLVEELRLQDVVEFKGRISEEEKCHLLSVCDVFIMPSFFIPNVTVEGFGLSLLEANSYGKFVISTRSGGIPEAVDNGRTGMLVKENDVKDLANAIIRFYDEDFAYDPEICISWAKERYITNIVGQYTKEINTILQ